MSSSGSDNYHKITSEQYDVPVTTMDFSRKGNLLTFDQTIKQMKGILIKLQEEYNLRKNQGRSTRRLCIRYYYVWYNLGYISSPGSGRLS